MTNTVSIEEFNRKADRILPPGKPLKKEDIRRLAESKIISKAVYIQLAIAYEFGVMTIPNYSDWESFAERWGDDDVLKISNADILEALAKLQRKFYSDADNMPFVQLNLLEP